MFVNVIVVPVESCLEYLFCVSKREENVTLRRIVYNYNSYGLKSKVEQSIQVLGNVTLCEYL